MRLFSNFKLLKVQQQLISNVSIIFKVRIVDCVHVLCDHDHKNFVKRFSKFEMYIKITYLLT